MRGREVQSGSENPVYLRILHLLFLSALILGMQSAALGQHPEKQKPEDYYGLYYASSNPDNLEIVALVISSNGQPIAPKANDPDAPTQPGLHVGQHRFPFAWSRFSAKGFAFRTARIGDTEYAFRGHFGREQVDVISGVPYLEGELTEKRNGHVLLSRKVHFGHAVIF